MDHWLYLICLLFRDLLDKVSVPLLGDDGPGAVVQLAARTLLSHLVNHLNHFPQVVVVIAVVVVAFVV